MSDRIVELELRHFFLSRARLLRAFYAELFDMVSVRYARLLIYEYR